MFAENALNYDTSRMVYRHRKKKFLTPLNVNRYRFFKLQALTVNDLHSPAVRCPLNVNGLLHK
jgi:hypothetical protein